MSEKKNVPKIRFPGFTDDWEQRKFGDIFTVSQGLQIPISERFTENGANRYFYITNEFLKDSCEEAYYIEDPSESVICDEEDILMTRTGNTGIVVTDVSGCFHNNFFKIKYDKESYSKRFICYLLSSPMMQKVILNNAGSSTIPDLSHKNFYKINALFPSSKKEQETVGEFLFHLDNLITLHQRKSEALSDYKKGMLQKMFPREGEKVPEIRFPGFTGVWEQRKLGDIADRVQGNDGRMDFPTLTISAANGWMNQVDRFSGNIAGKEQKNYTLLHKGELSYNHGNSKLAKYGTVFSLESYEEALVPRVYHSFKLSEGNPGFIEYLFATKIPDKELNKLISSGARMDGLLNIGYEDFMGINITIPSPAEQDIIAVYFRNLDNLITLHQRKCDELKEYKKGLLQQMFV